MYEIICKQCGHKYLDEFWDKKTGYSKYLICPHCGNKDQTESRCRVCGYELKLPMWDEEGVQDESIICDCCSNQGGVFDYDLKTILETRQRWFDTGCKWWDEYSSPPPGWDPIEQMKNIPAQFWG